MTSDRESSEPAPAPNGAIEGAVRQLFTLTNANGLVLKVTNYGTIVTELHVPDRSGKLADVVLGFESVEGYQKESPYFGATVGRVANRIRDAKFELEGRKYELAVNDGKNHLHGGLKGWDKVLWNATPVETPHGPRIEFTYVSKDGEEGYPGTVDAQVIYTLTNENEFVIEMHATTDKTTIVNMAHHTYWNLGGFAAGPITDHVLTLFADQYTPGDPMVPTGAILPVKGTPFDFTTAKPIGKDLRATGGTPVGYDHNFVVNGEPNALRPVARVKDPKSGRVMTLEANQPGVQFYSGNFLDGTTTGKGIAYAQHTGFCLETQKFPNAVGIPAWKDQVILRSGETYSHKMIHRFTTE
jgi:aldose 1-epimerase